MRQWNELPQFMRKKEVKPYYVLLSQRKIELKIKRMFDFIVSSVLIILLSPVMMVLAILIKCDSKGPVFFRQTRITTYGRKFRIFKFRTMVNNAEQIGTQVTTQSDIRVTNIGKKIRGLRLDELPQLFNVLAGDMTFVGTRPEVEKYVAYYNNEMVATLLLPAGITSKASIEYKDEEKLISGSDNVDETYVKEILPEKMKYNLETIRRFSLLSDFMIMIKTVFAVMK